MARASALQTFGPLAMAAMLSFAGPAAAAEPPVSFTRDIKGILSNRCVRCHGPDAEDRHGGGDEGLRLDTFEGATEDLGGHAAIVPGKPAESELIARITSTDPDVVMPPPEAGEPLSPDRRRRTRSLGRRRRRDLTAPTGPLITRHSSARANESQVSLEPGFSETGSRPTSAMRQAQPACGVNADPVTE